MMSDGSKLGGFEKPYPSVDAAVISPDSRNTVEKLSEVEGQLATQDGLQVSLSADDYPSLGSKDSSLSGLIPTSTSPARSNTKLNPIPATLITAILIAAVVGAYQRIGTSANADFIEFTQNLSGGFLAIGMSEDQPGFVVFSSLDPKEVDLVAQQSSNLVTGTYTTLHIDHHGSHWKKRLRGPIVAILKPDGLVEDFQVDWSVEDFRRMRSACDCEHQTHTKKVQRCGMPFDDISDVLATWPSRRVPDLVRRFITQRGHLDE